jgi:preprotein translocase subunit SecF
MLIGVLTGAYSTLAIASPMLLHMKDAVVKKPARENPYKAGDNKALEPGT